MRICLHSKIEDFISLIQSRPALYNFTLDEFNDKKLTEKLWKQVAREFFTNVKYCKAKWSSLRISFARQMRIEQINSQRTNEKLKNDWYLKDKMSFMRNYIRRRKKPKSIENYNNDNSLSKSNYEIKVKTENNLFNSSLEIRNEPVSEDENYNENENIECLEFFVAEEKKSDFVSIASSSLLSNSETININENEAKDTYETSYSALSSGTSKKKKSMDREDHSLSFSKRILTNEDCEPSLKKKKKDPILNSSQRNTKEQEDLSLTSFSSNLIDDPTITFFKSILPDFKKLTERRQRLLKQKVMGELHLLLDEQENES